MTDQQDYHAKGGLARTKSQTRERLTEIGKQGAAARWTLKFIKDKKGTIKEILGVDVPCYVLDNDDKTAVISQDGMAEALGYSTGGNLIRFFDSARMAPYMGADLRGKLEKPLIFQDPDAAQASPIIIHGHNVEDLI